MNYLSICSSLKHLRENAGYTPDALARFFGMDATLIENWESGISEPTISECLVLSRLYGIPLDQMFPAFSVRSLIPEDCLECFDRIVQKSKTTNLPDHGVREGVDKSNFPSYNCGGC